MSFPPYADYKDSGVAWLGGVPGHWEVGRIKDLFEIQKRIAGELGHDVLSITQSGLKVKDIDSNDGQLSMDYSKYQLVYPGDFAMNHMDLLTGWIDIATMPGVTSPDYRVFSARANQDVVPAYYLYAFQMAYSQRQFYPFGQGSSQLGRWRLPTDAFYAFSILRPPLAEQQAIVGFLDREVAKIDGLVAEQERLIALLREKRQAVISHAVTTGLNPSAPLKDSGIEWLGQIPEHWEATALKRLCDKVTDGAHISPETEGGTRAFVSTKDVSDDGIDFEGCLLTSESSYEYLVRTGCQPVDGDVLFSKDGTIGRTTVVRGAKDFVVASSLIIIRPTPSYLDADFLDYLCQSQAVKNQVESFVKGAGLPRLSIQNLLRVNGVFPPICEQKAIAAWLSNVLGGFKLLMSEAQSAITLLQERRAALISAAVTGKIDVRAASPADGPAELETA